MKPRTKAALLAIICILSFIFGSWLGYRFLHSTSTRPIIWVWLPGAIFFWIVAIIAVRKGNNIIGK